MSKNISIEDKTYFDDENNNSADDNPCFSIIDNIEYLIIATLENKNNLYFELSIDRNSLLYIY